MRISDWISDVCSSVLVTEPKILLLDEPLSALDAHLKVRMQTVLSNLQRELGITFVYVTHSQSEAFSMADRVVIMSRGKIEQIGDPQEIYRAPRTKFVAEFLGSSNIFSGRVAALADGLVEIATPAGDFRSEEHTSELQSLMRISYAVFCLKKKITS